MPRVVAVLVVGALLALGCLAAWANMPDVIGSVRTVKGQAEVVRGDQSLKANQSLQLKRGDVLKTGADGSMGVILRDDTTLSLGPDSTLSLDEFLFQPLDNKMSLATKMVKGTAVYISGGIGRLAPDKVKMKTPVATIGIRGTRFLVKVEN